MEKKYRIREKSGDFNIEIYASIETGFLWWKKIDWDWFPTNDLGGRWILWDYDCSQNFSKTFKNIEDAKNQISEWNGDDEEGINYHYI